MCVAKLNVLGLFKNVQMQGAQKTNRETYIDISRAIRFAGQHSRPWYPSGYERFSTAHLMRDFVVTNYWREKFLKQF
jgi:hypothetical protein